MSKIMARLPKGVSVRRIFITVLIAAGLISGGTPAAVAAAPAPGTIVSATVITLPADLAAKGTAVRIEYRTTDIRGAAITATGLILTPKTTLKRNRVVVWAHGTTGITDACVPSTNYQVFWPEARKAVLELLRRGYTVAAPDYPGLGTPQAHPYLVGESEARSIIDIAKSSRILYPGLGKEYALDGHSQGGQGVLFAGEIAPSYDGDLVLKGLAAIAPASNLDVIAPDIPGTEGQGYLVMAVAGLSAVDSSVKPEQVFTSYAKSKAAELPANACLNEILAKFRPLTAEQLVPNGQVPPTIVSKLGQYGNPAQRPPTSPILVVHGTADVAVPYVITEQFLIPQLQAWNKPYPITLVTLEGRDHEGAVYDSTVTVADQIDRWLGFPVPQH
ncbi:lipase [Actinoplanes sp. NBRC 103695]|nr:lipase [Actinoplanes sp. NBRC 103695]